MNKSEVEHKLVALISEAVEILKEYEPQSGYLAATYMEEHGSRTMRIYNDAFKKDGIKALDIWSDNPEIKKREVKTIDLDELPELHTLDEFFDVFDDNVCQIGRMANSGEFLVLAALLKTKIREGMK